MTPLKSPLKRGESKKSPPSRGGESQHPITINLLGDIAAGKGTQAKILMKKYQFRLLDTGSYSRRILAGRSKVSKRLEKVRLGKLAPSDIIRGYLASEISKLKNNEPVLIDGVKMPAEAKLLYNLLKKKNRRPLVIYISIPKRETFRRLRYRFYDKKTGKPLIIDPAKVKNGKYRGREVIKRADDDLGAVQNRIEYYDKVYSKTVDFWKAKGLLAKINGNQSIKKVTQSIERAINNRFQNH